MIPTTPAVSVVIPLFNEQDNIEMLQRELHAALKGLSYEIVFVDDGSKDETVQRVEVRPDVQLLVFEKNAGQSAAMIVATSKKSIRFIAEDNYWLAKQNARLKRGITGEERIAPRNLTRMALPGLADFARGCE